VQSILGSGAQEIPIPAVEAVELEAETFQAALLQEVEVAQVGTLKPS
jgi:hypothetical protein